jgi:integrase
MGRKAVELGPLAASRLTAPGLHFVGGVAGLALQVTASGARSWVLRVQVGDKRRDMGLGGFPDVTLASARDAARVARAKVKEGIDPIANARAVRSALKADQAAAKTFKFCALAYIDTHEAGWRNAKHAQQWRNTLETYAYPLIGDLLVRDIGLPQVLAVLEPIWTSKTETASRLRGRLESVLDWATTRGYRTGLNPARWKGHLDTVLPAAGTVANAGHHSALPVREIGAFMKTLRGQAGMSARALEFTILTAARSGEVRGACWAEIDVANAVWTVPGDRMKAGKEHRVPLSDAALAVLNSLPHEDRDALVFASPRGGMLSDMSLTAVLRRMKVGAVPHGFRSSFRDWCAERTNHPREVAEMALAHVIGDKVEAAYRRGDLFDKRRRLMDDWAAFCANPEPRKGTVISMNAARP